MSELRVSDRALASFREHQEEIIARATERAMKRREEVAHHGANAERIIHAGLGFVTRMLDAALATGESSLLEEQLAWGRSRLPIDGVQPEHVRSRLEIYRATVLDVMPEPYAGEIAEAVGWMVRRHDELGEEPRQGGAKK